MRANGPDQSIPAENMRITQHLKRYTLLLNKQRCIIDDMAMINHQDLQFIIRNSTFKQSDMAYIKKMPYLEKYALIALQGIKSIDAISHLNPRVSNLAFINGYWQQHAGFNCYITHKGYTSLGGFKISVQATQAEKHACIFLAQPEEQRKHITRGQIGPTNKTSVQALALRKYNPKQFTAIPFVTQPYYHG